MYLDRLGLALWPPFAARILVVPYLLLLFRVYGNSGLATLQEFRRLRVDVLKLRIAVGMRGAFLGLAVRLQAVLLFVQQFRNQHMAHLVSLGPQFVGEIAHALAGPPQRGLGIPSRNWFQQFLQIDQEIRILERCLLAATAFLPNRQTRPLGAIRLLSQFR